MDSADDIDQPLNSKSANISESTKKASYQSFAKQLSRPKRQQETNTWPRLCQSSTTDSCGADKFLKEATPTSDLVTVIDCKYPSASVQQAYLERKKQLWSWRGRQAKRVERRKERRRNTDSSTLSLHSSRTISEFEMSHLLSVNHPDLRILNAQSRIKANEAFSSGYDCFMSFKPRQGKRAIVQDQSFHGHHTAAAHNTRLLGALETQELVTVKSVQQQIRTARHSARLPQRCYSPAPCTPPASRASTAMPILKNQRPRSVRSTASPMTIHFPSKESNSI
ncbi:uncharacterized protein LOC134189854 [Corticium candelabrum]|uniref:uncharacterized protein LOC134189854 n=1 Tax=Corticium candelabrum TaxID=121492 RepID=UPI002E266971|nr:uncharacterized protein LOC134189854 [Corticium candelabrum]